MKKMSVISSSEEVMANLKWYLEFRKFKNIRVDHSAGEIMAERKKFFFGKTHVINLKVKQVNHETTNIELIVNPKSIERTGNEELLEENLRAKIYHYL
jgi:hypothetical protein